MKVLVVEDEEIVARRLIRMVGTMLTGRSSTIEWASEIRDAKVVLSERPFDLVFLDLNLNGQDGFQLLGDAAAGAFQTIIVSAHADQAIRAFEYGVVDFVPKPFDEDRLRRAIERATKRDPNAGEHLRRLAVRRHGEIRFVPLETIAWISGAGDYSEIHCEDGTTHLHDKTLTALELILPSRFERVHRSHIVDFSRAVGIRAEPGSRYRLHLAGGDEVPVSRAAASRLRERFRQPS